MLSIAAKITENWSRLNKNNADSVLLVVNPPNTDQSTMANTIFQKNYHHKKACKKVVKELAQTENRHWECHRHDKSILLGSLHMQGTRSNLHVLKCPGATKTIWHPIAKFMIIYHATITQRAHRMALSGSTPLTTICMKLTNLDMRIWTKAKTKFHSSIKPITNGQRISSYRKFTNMASRPTQVEKAVN